MAKYMYATYPITGEPPSLSTDTGLHDTVTVFALPVHAMAVTLAGDSGRPTPGTAGGVTAPSRLRPATFTEYTVKTYSILDDTFVTVTEQH